MLFQTSTSSDKPRRAVPSDTDRNYGLCNTFIVKELGHSKFLRTLAPILLSKTLYRRENPYDNAERFDRHRMVMHTQNLGHGYYNDIWNALPTLERYLLYDLAKDGFLNIKNRNSLFSLMKKGLVVWRDRPTIFNYSFKNFIITSVSMNEALRLENKNRGEGTWGEYPHCFLSYHYYDHCLYRFGQTGADKRLRHL